MEVYMSKLIDDLKRVAYGLSFTVVALFAVAIVGYIVKVNFVEEGESVGFQLATISAVIGGLVLTSGFLDRESSKPDLALSLRRVGVVYLIATLAFVVFGVCFPLIDVSFYFVLVSLIGMVIGAFCFAAGSVLLAMKVPQLWSSS
jgi:hypothetical protein